MPIYEYACDACGHQLERMQKISEAPLSECPACGESSLRKLISRAGFRLKGGGWYVTDFRDKGKPAAKGKDGADAGDSAASGDGGKSDAGKSATGKSDTGSSSTPTASDNKGSTGPSKTSSKSAD